MPPTVRVLQTVHDTAVLRDFSLDTTRHRDFIDVTARVNSLVSASQISEGICLIYSPHTTAAITINENADPDVVTDLLAAYADMVGDEARFRHAEGNSGGHALTSLVGPSVAVPVRDGSLVLGQWQAVYFCEFDGPRRRTIQVQVVGERGGST